LFKFKDYGVVDGDLLVKKGISNWQVFIQARGSQESRGRLFNAIWTYYQKRLLYFICNMTRGNAEDLFQEVMLKVYQNLEKYNPIYSFNTWIYTIARNHCLNYLHKGGLPAWSGIMAAEEGPVERDCDTPEDRALYKELHQTIGAALDKLNDDNRQIAFLRFFEGMKDGDIAGIMQLPAGTVKSRLHSIRMTLKEKLEKYHER
jgi:RNA polymerase sigma-70 factor (ECF subfamily)